MEVLGYGGPATGPERPAEDLERRREEFVARAKAASDSPCAREPIRGSWWAHPKGNDIFLWSRAIRERGMSWRVA